MDTPNNLITARTPAPQSLRSKLKRKQSIRALS
jgi:hypothetical protein